ncbi:MAG: PAS domain S-box protein [Thermaerobacter sp.]|jgi:putative two-component system response regulator|nr:PAS domain S-box protein [Thermaerobacter sp.]
MSSLELTQALADAFRDALDGIVITDEQAVIREVNPAYEQICGYSREELVGQPASVLKSGKTPPERYRQLWDQLLSEGRWTGELLNRKKSGEEWWSFLSITRLADAQGRALGYFGVARDVTRARQTARELERELAELHSVQDVSITALAKLAEHRDPDIEGHLARIKRYCELMVRALEGQFPELSPGYGEAVVAGSVLHDVGKVAVPEGILFKPGRLSPEEFSVMKLHSLVGGKVLGEAEVELRRRMEVSETFLSRALEIAMYHHEKWDGTGYPAGLSREAIPLSARIVAVADVYDALTSRRVYKDAWSREAAREELERGAGQHFDSRVVAAFLQEEARAQEAE